MQATINNELHLAVPMDTCSVVAAAPDDRSGVGLRLSGGPAVCARLMRLWFASQAARASVRDG